MSGAVLRCLPDCIPGLGYGPDSRGLRQVHDAWGAADTLSPMGVLCAALLGVVVLAGVVLGIMGWRARDAAVAVIPFLVVVAVALAGLSVATLAAGSVWFGLAGLFLAVFIVLVAIVLDERSWSGNRRG